MAVKRSDARPGNRVRLVSFRASEEEYEAIKAEAARLHVAHTGLCRALVLDGITSMGDGEKLPAAVARIVPASKQLPQEALEAARELSVLRLELSRGNNNLNQIAHQMNQRGTLFAPPETVHTVDDLRRTVSLLVQKVDEIHAAVFEVGGELAE